MPLLNYTTKIDPDKTCSEISRALSSHGAQAIMTEYDKESHLVSALSFKITVNGKDMGFRLPADWRPVMSVLIKQRESNKRVDDSQEAAVRVSWRILKVWIDAQMALIETQMVKTHEVFLPYLIMPNDKTLSENLAVNPGFLLGNGK